MLVRVRSNVGVWRVEELNDNNATVSDVLEGIARTRPHVVYEQPLSSDPACKSPLDATKALTEQGLGHGSMIHCRVDPASCATVTTAAAVANESGADVNMQDNAAAGGDSSSNNGAMVPNKMRRVIDKDGAIKLVPCSDAEREQKGFRKGMLPLRDMKMQWTLNDFMAMDAQFQFKIQRQEEKVCQQVSLDMASVTDFQSYLQRFQFQRKRIGFLYGKFVPYNEETKDENNEKEKKDDKEEEKSKLNRKVLVEAIYEPPQDVDQDSAEGFALLDDPDEDTVDQIAGMLGWTKVGWIFGHEPREPGYVLSAAEVIMAAEFQLEAANGVEETPFCTVKVTMNDKDKSVSVEAFQVSQQCMAMVAEEALQVHPEDPKLCQVNETFTAIQEGKESKTVENNFFLTVVPIVQHQSELQMIAEFPRANRELDDRSPSHDEMKRHLQKSGRSGWTFIDRLADFNLLIYLAKFLDVNADYPKICASIVDRTVPLDDGYKLIIKSMAGLEGSY